MEIHDLVLAHTCTSDTLTCEGEVMEKHLKHVLSNYLKDLKVVPPMQGAKKGATIL